MEERRKSNRRKAAGKSKVHSEQGLTYSNTVDISKGGIFISTPEPLGIGSPISLAVQIPGHGSLELKGIVRWVRNDDKEGERAGMGIEFTEISEAKVDALKKFLT